MSVIPHVPVVDGVGFAHPTIAYSTDGQLHAAVGGHLAGPLRAGDTAVLVSTADRLAGVAIAVGAEGVDVDGLRRVGRYVELDAVGLLDAVLAGEDIDRRGLASIVAEFDATARAAGGRLQVFSQLGPILWDRGLVAAAVQLEELGDHLVGVFDIGLVCGYRHDGSSTPDGPGSYSPLCARHAEVVGEATSGHTGMLPSGRLEQAVFDTWDGPVAVLDQDGTILAVNAVGHDFYGQSVERPAMVGDHYLAVLERANIQGSDAAAGVRAVLEGDRARFEYEYAHRLGGELRWTRLTAYRLPERHGGRIVVRHEDRTVERAIQVESTIRAQQLDAIDAAVVATDLDGVVQMWNAAAQRLHGWTEQEAIGQRIEEVTVPVEHREGARDAFASILANGGWDGELQGAHRDGTTFPAYVRNHVVHDGHGVPTGIIGIAVDLSEQVERQRALARNNTSLRAITDRMGEGLCNLGPDGRIIYINPKGEQLLGIEAGAADGGSFTNRLLGCQPDGTANDPSQQLIGADFDGHVPGEVTEDRLLRADGTILPIEYVATPLPSGHDSQPDAWVVTFRDITDRLEQQEQLHKDAHHGHWMTRIQDALDHDRFVLYAQPIVDIATGDTVQNELLIRLNDPEEGIVSPGAFLPTAEAFGLAPAIDRWVIGQAIDLVAAGRAVEVNLSARSFCDPSLPRHIQQLLNATGADPTLLAFELTETALLENDVEATRFARRIHDLGCQLALDDFGTGYGAFTYLKHLPVDLLKIDIEFVRDAVTQPASRHVIEAVVSLARSFGIATVAEGVEDQPTLDLLAELGVDQAQGYYLCRPGPLETTLLPDSNQALAPRAISTNDS